MNDILNKKMCPCKCHEYGEPYCSGCMVDHYIEDYEENDKDQNWEID